MVIETLVPDKYIQLFSTDDSSKIKISIFERKLLVPRFNKSLKNFLNDFCEISIASLDNDLAVLADPILKKQLYDNESIKYNLSILNGSKISEYLNTLNFNDLYIKSKMLDILTDWPYMKKIIKNIDVSTISTRKSMLDLIEEKIENICIDKNLQDFYYQKMHTAKNEIIVLKKYMNALTKS